jgi:hypothetical protein
VTYVLSACFSVFLGLCGYSLNLEFPTEAACEKAKAAVLKEGIQKPGPDYLLSETGT